MSEDAIHIRRLLCLLVNQRSELARSAEQVSEECVHLCSQHGAIRDHCIRTKSLLSDLASGLPMFSVGHERYGPLNHLNPDVSVRQERNRLDKLPTHMRRNGWMGLSEYLDPRLSNRSFATAGEFTKMTTCPSTVTHVRSPRVTISIYMTLEGDALAVFFGPFLIDEPRLFSRYLEEVPYERKRFRTRRQGPAAITSPRENVCKENQCNA